MFGLQKISKVSCKELALDFGVLIISKIFENCMQFYSYGAVLKKRMHFWANSDAQNFFPFFLFLSGIRTAVSGLVQGL